jgi:hypothetical protein
LESYRYSKGSMSTETKLLSAKALPALFVFLSRCSPGDNRTPAGSADIIYIFFLELVGRAFYTLDPFLSMYAAH